MLVSVIQKGEEGLVWGNGMTLVQGVFWVQRSGRISKQIINEIINLVWRLDPLGHSNRGVRLGEISGRIVHI